MEYHYYVLLTNSTIELDPIIPEWDDRLELGALTVLPQEPKSAKDGTLLRELIYEAINEVVQSERKAIDAELKDYEEQDLAAGPAYPPDWIVAIGIWLFGVISSGATWDIIKVSVTKFVSSIIQKEWDARQSEYEIEQLVKTYMRKDFSQENVLYELYQSIQKVHQERGSEFDPIAVERAVFEEIIASRRAFIKEKRERKERERREKEKNRRDLINDLTNNDTEGVSDAKEALNLCKSIDVYLMNGIEDDFLLPSVSTLVSDAVDKIVRETSIPEDALRDFRRFNILGEGHKLTEFGQLTFQRLAKLRTHGRIPKSMFRRDFER